MKDFITNLKTTVIDYEKELEHIIIPTQFTRSSNFEAGEIQAPIPVIGIDAKTNEVLYECSSISEAQNMGFHNFGMIVSDKHGRSQSGGVRWFKAEDFDPTNIPPLEIPNAKAVCCVERNQHFRSTIDAEKQMKEMGFKVTGSKISAVLNGKRPKAGGFTWKLSALSTNEILAQDPKGFIDYQPPKGSNEPRTIRLTSVNDTNVKKDFISLSEAGRFLGTSAGGVSQALNNKGIVKGYKAEEISKE